MVDLVDICLCEALRADEPTSTFPPDLGLSLRMLSRIALRVGQGVRRAAAVRQGARGPAARHMSIALDSGAFTLAHVQVVRERCSWRRVAVVCAGGWTC